MLFAATQAKFEELGLADADALEDYKAIKIEQVKRMYEGRTKLVSETQVTFDVADAVAKINAATTYQGVSDAYFAAIQGYLPKYC